MSAVNPFRKRIICVENPFFHIALNKSSKFVKRDGSYLLIVDCDDCLKHDRLLTLSRYIYSNTGANIVLPPSL